MRRKAVIIGGLLVLLASFGVGVYRLVGAQTGPASPTPQRLTPAELDEQIRRGRQQYHASQAAFIADFVRSGRDPRTLPIGQLEGYAAPGPADLSTAVAEADLIVVGMVVRTDFAAGDPFPVARHTMAVERVLKGTAPAHIVIRQYGGPGLRGADDQQLLLQLEDDPLLLPRDRALLFLKVAHGEPGSYSIEVDGGQYRLEAGRALPEGSGHSFLAEVEGLSEQQLADRIVQLVPLTGHPTTTATTPTQASTASATPSSP